jgi:hypothetical protein
MRVYTVISSQYLDSASTSGVVLRQQSAAFLFAIVLFGGAVATGRAGSVEDVSATAWISALVSGGL